MATKDFINIQLFDTFTRQYQVLKNRTHPMMSMDGFGGYVLHAIKVVWMCMIYNIRSTEIMFDII